jgi:FKBP-type peptidyl-prolyl cis-trans isomerase FkpA
MTKKIVLLLLLLPLGYMVTAQQKGFKVSPSGLQYKFYKNKEGANLKEGDIVKLNFAMTTEKDSLLRSTFGDANPVEMPLQKGAFKASLEEGLLMMSPGDSAMFLINADSLFAKMFNAQLPPFIRKGSYIGFLIKIISKMTAEEKKAEDAKTAAESVGKEDKLILDYMAKNNLKGIKTASGMYYVQTKAGNGVKAEKGKTVSVHYTGTLLNGTKFDSSVDRGQPFDFGLGAGQVIAGWDEGLALMSVGEKGILLIPSRLGYGPRGAGGSIPPNSTLVFDVELLGVK